MANPKELYSIYVLAYAQREAFAFDEFSKTCVSALGCIHGRREEVMLMPSGLAARLRDMGAEQPDDGESVRRELEQAKEALTQACGAVDELREAKTKMRAVDAEVRVILEAAPDESTLAAARRVASAVPDCGLTDRDLRERDAAQERLQRLILAEGKTDTGGLWLFDTAADEIVRLRNDRDDDRAALAGAHAELSRLRGEAQMAREALDQARAKVEELRTRLIETGHEANRMMRDAREQGAAEMRERAAALVTDLTSPRMKVSNFGELAERIRALSLSGAPYAPQVPALTDEQRAALRGDGWTVNDGRWAKRGCEVLREDRFDHVARLIACASDASYRAKPADALSAEDAATLRGAGYVERDSKWKLSNRWAGPLYDPSDAEGLAELRGIAADLRAKAPPAAHGEPATGKATTTGGDHAASGSSSVAEEPRGAQGGAPRATGKPCSCAVESLAFRARPDSSPLCWTCGGTRIAAGLPKPPRVEVGQRWRCEHQKICDMAIERLGAEKIEGLWPAASRVKKERDEARADYRRVSESLSRACNDLDAARAEAAALREERDLLFNEREGLSEQLYAAAKAAGCEKVSDLALTIHRLRESGRAAPADGAPKPWRGIVHVASASTARATFGSWYVDASEYGARFYGPHAEERAREYAAFVSASVAPEPPNGPREESPPDMRIEKRADGEYLINSGHVINDCLERQGHVVCHYHLDGEHISTSTRHYADGSELVTARWPIAPAQDEQRHIGKSMAAAPAAVEEVREKAARLVDSLASIETDAGRYDDLLRLASNIRTLQVEGPAQDRPSDLEKIEALHAETSAAVRDGVERMLAGAEVMTSADGSVTLLARNGVESRAVLATVAELLGLPPPEYEIARAEAQAHERGVEEGERRAAVQIPDLMRRTHDDGIAEGERRAKAKAAGLVTKWDTARQHQLKLRDATSKSEPETWARRDSSALIRRSCMCELADAFDIPLPASPPDGQPPTGGEPGPEDGGGFPADVPPEVDEQIAEIAIKAGERVADVMAQRRDRIAADLGGVIRAAISENLLPHEIAHRVLRRMEHAHGFGAIASQRPAAGAIDRAHADGVVEGLKRAESIVGRTAEQDDIKRRIWEAIYEVAAGAPADLRRLMDAPRGPGGGERDPAADEQREARVLSELRRAHHDKAEGDPIDLVDRWKARWERLSDEVERESGLFERAYLHGLRDAYTMSAAELHAERDPSAPSPQAAQGSGDWTVGPELLNRIVDELDKAYGRASWAGPTAERILAHVRGLAPRGAQPALGYDDGEIDGQQQGREKARALAERWRHWALDRNEPAAAACMFELCEAFGLDREGPEHEPGGDKGEPAESPPQDGGDAGYAEPLVALGFCVGSDCIDLHGTRIATWRGHGPSSIYIVCDECYAERLTAEEREHMTEVRGAEWVRHLGLHDMHHGRLHVMRQEKPASPLQDVERVRKALRREADSVDAQHSEGLAFERCSTFDPEGLREAASLVESERDARFVLCVLGYNPQAIDRVLGTSQAAAQDGSSEPHGSDNAHSGAEPAEGKVS